MKKYKIPNDYKIYKKRRLNRNTYKKDNHYIHLYDLDITDLYSMYNNVLEGELLIIHLDVKYRSVTFDNGKYKTLLPVQYRESISSSVYEYKKYQFNIKLKSTIRHLITLFTNSREERKYLYYSTSINKIREGEIIKNYIYE